MVGMVDVVRRLLVRTGFTAPAVTGGDFATVLDFVLADRPDPGVTATPPPTLDLEIDRKTDKKAYQQAVREQARTLTRWWLDRLVAAERPWTERRTLLWHGHWAT